MTPLRASRRLLQHLAVRVFRVTEWAAEPQRPVGLVGAVYAPFILGGFLLAAAVDPDYVLLGAVLPAVVLYSLNLHGERMAPLHPVAPTPAQRLDALLARTDEAGVGPAVRLGVRGLATAGDRVGQWVVVDAVGLTPADPLVVVSSEDLDSPGHPSEQVAWVWPADLDEHLSDLRVQWTGGVDDATGSRFGP